MWANGSSVLYPSGRKIRYFTINRTQNTHDNRTTEKENALLRVFH
jgi:hypothetical protein